jgi:hypothetical protein
LARLPARNCSHYRRALLLFQTGRACFGQEWDAVVEIAGEFATFRECYEEQPEKLKAALHAGVVAYLQRAANDEGFPLETQVSRL